MKTVRSSGACSPGATTSSAVCSCRAAGVIVTSTGNNTRLLSGSDRIDAHRDLLPGKSEIGIFDVARTDEFLECLEFMPLPVRIIEIFVEQDHGSVHEPRREKLQDGLGRTVEIAIDVDESDRSGIVGQPWRQAGVEVALVQPHVIRHARQAAFDVERLAAEAETRPRLGQALEAVETVDGAWADFSRDVADRAAGEDAEFEIMAVDGDGLQRIVDQIALVFETERVRHRALDVVDAALQSAQGTFADRMNPSGVDKLIRAADDLVEHVFQLEVGDQHGNRKSFLSARRPLARPAPFSRV